MFSSHRSAASAPVIGHSSIAGGVGARGWGARRRLRQAQDLSACPAGGSRPVTRRDPALGTKTDSEPESQRTVISGSSTAAAEAAAAGDWEGVGVKPAELVVDVGGGEAPLRAILAAHLEPAERR